MTQGLYFWSKKTRTITNHVILLLLIWLLHAQAQNRHTYRVLSDSFCTNFMAQSNPYWPVQLLPTMVARSKLHYYMVCPGDLVKKNKVWLFQFSFRTFFLLRTWLRIEMNLTLIHNFVCLLYTNIIANWNSHTEEHKLRLEWRM